MKKTRQEAGRLGENLVSDYLQAKGFLILARNWHAGRYGEIDIVAQKDEELFVVEVKTKQWPCFVNPETMVNGLKINKLNLSAQSFVLQHPNWPQRISLLVVAVILFKSGQVKEIKVFPV